MRAGSRFLSTENKLDELSRRAIKRAPIEDSRYVSQYEWCLRFFIRICCLSSLLIVGMKVWVM